MRAAGKDPQTRILEDDEYLESLFEKLLEEARELQEAAPATRLEEAADVLEVLATIVRNLGHEMPDVELRAEEKRAERGGFADRIWLESW